MGITKIDLVAVDNAVEGSERYVILPERTFLVVRQRDGLAVDHDHGIRLAILQAIDGNVARISLAVHDAIALVKTVVVSQVDRVGIGSAVDVGRREGRRAFRGRAAQAKAVRIRVGHVVQPAVGQTVDSEVTTGAVNELIARDKTSLDLFWLKDKSLADLDNLPEPEILAEEIIDNIESGLANFRAVAAKLAIK